jgi:hypothetical protein
LTNTKGRHPIARALLVLAVFASLYGCGQASSPPAEPENAEGIEQAESDEEHVGITTKSCSDFYGPQDAQAYFETKATTAEKRVLNSDGDEWACNEPGVNFKPEPEISLDTFDELSDRESMGLLQCQYIKYAQDHGEKAANEYIDQALDEEFANGELTDPNAEITSIQEHFIQDGYSCTWHEINEAMMRMDTSASAPTTMDGEMSKPHGE